METVPPNPFKGLRSFEEKDRNTLFGRDRDLILMKDRIFSARTTLLFAGSGVGKTSFLNAKVVPELRKQCEIVWHNRWTGADTQQDDDWEFSNQPRIRRWPPTALFRDLKQRFVGGKASESARNSDSPGPIDDLLSFEVRNSIAQSLRPPSFDEPPSPDKQRQLSEVLARFRKSATTNSSATGGYKDRCILILDQFEEVFQYHAYEEYFAGFIKDLCEIINNEDYQVRIVFSMREEFLGELSIFDSKIPDLFNNYYRLRYPNKEEAEDIIARTCQLSGVDADQDKLTVLVEDLSKIEKGSGTFSERSTNRSASKTRVIRRTFVAPPYLQIACERLWQQQYGAARTAPVKAVKSQVEDAKPFDKFLIDYRTGNGDSTAGEPGGDAQKALRDFCQEKLSPPFLTRTQQDLIARAFGFLVTKQGAKMAYELRSLAEHMDESVLPLKTALEKLSTDEAKILRESRGPDRSYWFELYHDMYATIVDEWKIGHLKLKKRRALIRAAAVAVAFPLVLILIFALFHWIINPMLYMRQLENFRSNVNSSELEQQTNYPDAVAAFSSLKGTSGYASKANSLWADILARRAQWFEIGNDPRSALLSLLKAAALESDTRWSNRHLKDAEILLGTENTGLLDTFCDDCEVAGLSPDGTKVLTMNRDGPVRLWNTSSGEPIGSPFCDFCDQSESASASADEASAVPTSAYRNAIFSSDGKTVLTAVTVPSLADQPEKLRIQVWDSATQNQVGSDFDMKAAMPGKDASDRLTIQAFVRFGDRILMAGSFANQLFVSSLAGSGQALANAKVSEITFSADGRYLLATFAQDPVRLWQVTDNGVVDYPLIQLEKSTAAYFSPDGSQLLIERNHQTVLLVDLASKTTVVSLQQLQNQLHNVGFSPSGEQFFTESLSPVPGTEETQIWSSTSGERLSAPLKYEAETDRTILGPEGKTLLRAIRRNSVIEKWDMQSGRLLALVKRPFTADPAFLPDGNTALITEQKMVRLWQIDSSFPGSKVLDTDLADGTISANGRVLAGRNGSKIQFWNADTATLIGESADVKGRSSVIQMSDDGVYAANVGEDKLLRLWEVGKREPVFRVDYPNAAEVMAFSADNKVLAVAAGPRVDAWLIPGGSKLALAQGHSDTINGIALTSRKMITGSDDKTARIWDLSSMKSDPLPTHPSKVTAVALNSDGRLAVTGSENGRLRLWDTETRQQIGGVVDYEGSITHLAFSSDGRVVSALTQSWLYLCTVDAYGLHYARGSLVAEETRLQFSMLNNGSVLRFAYPAGTHRVQIQDLDQTDKLITLNGDAATRLNEWEQRLGLRISELGEIENKWPTEVSAAAATYNGNCCPGLTILTVFIALLQLQKIPSSAKPRARRSGSAR
jgi:WD40 repeat protein